MTTLLMQIYLSGSSAKKNLHFFLSFKSLLGIYIGSPINPANIYIFFGNLIEMSGTWSEDLAQTAGGYMEFDPPVGFAV